MKEFLIKLRNKNKTKYEKILQENKEVANIL